MSQISNTRFSNPLLHWHFFCLVILLCAVQPVLADRPELVIQEAQSPLSLDGTISWLRDAEGNLDIEEVIDHYKAGRFTPAKGYPSLGYTRNTIWFSFTVHNRSAQQNWMLKFSPAFLDDIHLYQLDDRQITDHGQLGKHQIWQGWKWPWRHSVYQVELDEQPSTFFVAVNSRTNIALHPSLWQRDDLIIHATREMLSIGFLFGVGSLLVILSFFLFLVLREKLFLYYAIYTASFTLIVLIIEGLIHYLLQPSAPLNLDFLQVFLQAIFTVSIVYLFVEITDLREHQPHFSNRLLISTRLSALLFLVPLVFGRIDLSIALLWLLLLIMAIIIPLITMSMRKSLGWSAYLYASAFAIVAFAAISRLVWVFGITEMSLLSEWGIFMTIPAHVLILYLAIVIRYVEQQSQSERTQKELLKIVSESEQRLEHEVAERTDELARLNDDLGKALAQSQENSTALATARDQLQKSLEVEKQATLSQRRFLRMVGHEFRTPLSTIQTASLLIENGQLGDIPQVRENVERVQQAVERMSALVDQTLREDKFDVAAWRKNAEPVHVSSLIEESLTYARSIDNGKRSLSAKGSEYLRIHGDHDLLLTMLNNVLDNAMKYSPPGSHIDISASISEQDEIVISVTDQGYGMSADEVEQIFDKYFRANHSAEIPGIGLGMYLVDRIVRLHGARVTIRSETGFGTRISVIFPAREKMERDQND